MLILQVGEVETELQQLHMQLQEAKQGQQALTAAAADSALQAQHAQDHMAQGEQEVATMRLQLEVHPTAHRVIHIAFSRWTCPPSRALSLSIFITLEALGLSITNRSSACTKHLQAACGTVSVIRMASSAMCVAVHWNGMRGAVGVQPHAARQLQTELQQSHARLGSCMSVPVLMEASWAQEAQAGADQARLTAKQATDAAESAQRHAEWQARRIAELEAQVAALTALQGLEVLGIGALHVVEASMTAGSES